MARKPSVSIVLVGFVGYLVALLVGFSALNISKALHSGFAGADESSHFLNGLFISSYLKFHLAQNPLAYAIDYYIHYPKLSIGHWPPAYYGFLGLIFTGISATSEHAMIINVFVSSFPAVAVATLLYRLGGLLPSTIGVLIYAWSPMVFEGFNFFMVDQALTALALAATFACVSYVEKQTWLRALTFACLFTIAVLVKGNGWLLVFVPVYYLLLTKQWRVLLNVRIYIALLLAACVVVPWYAVTSKISADGFNYQPGIQYAARALASNLSAFATNLSWLSLLLAVVAIKSAFQNRIEQQKRWYLICACLSLILSALTLQSLVPADIVERYMAPALPAVVVLGVLGAFDLYKVINEIYKLPRTAVSVLLILFIAMAIPGAIHVKERTPKLAYQLKEAVRFIPAEEKTNISLIDGSAGAEGAFIAEAAVADSSTKSYVVRSSKILADSNFMGGEYHLRYSSSDAILEELKRLGIEYIVLVHNARETSYPHSEQLATALNAPISPYQKIASLKYDAGTGKTDVYKSMTPLVPNINAVRQLGTPAKANVITQHSN